ncbi:hypothetical protein [Nitratireductor sp. GCM10026969]|uniref:hypothetical protein n=1 Tax=Nitratireductor sp. GCM10026969 TaxID=3252645 RepID=UPI00361075F4
MNQPTPPPSDIALFHNYFASRGGGERLVLGLGGDNVVVANSQNTRARISRYLGCEIFGGD